MAGSKRTAHTTATPSRSDAGPTAPEAGDQVSAPSRAEIATGCAAAATESERRRWQVIVLLANQTPLAEIVAATGCRPRTIRQIAQRFRELGPTALVDGRQRSLGAARILSAEQQHELHQMLQHPAPDGGAWTGPLVARWIAARTGKRVHRQRGWEYLQRLGPKDER